MSEYFLGWVRAIGESPFVRLRTIKPSYLGGYLLLHVRYKSCWRKNTTHKPHPKKLNISSTGVGVDSLERNAVVHAGGRLCTLQVGQCKG